MFNFPSEAVEVILALQTNGYAAYFCGGCVRDALLNRAPKDYDIVTSAMPDEIEALFPHTIAVGKAFGIINVIGGGRAYDVATFNAGGGAFTPATPQEDAQRRDFTINALFYDPVAEKLIDYCGGENDLRGGRIRTCRHPDETFADDELRMLRALRFMLELPGNWVIDDPVWESINGRYKNLESISTERITKELDGLFLSGKVSRLFDGPVFYDILNTVIPETVAVNDFDQNTPYHPEVGLWSHIALMFGEFDRQRAINPVEVDGALLKDGRAPRELFSGDDQVRLAWAILLHDIAKPVVASDDHSHFHGHDKVGEGMARKILTRLKMSTERIDTIGWLIANHMKFSQARAMRLSTRRRLMRHPSFKMLLGLHYLDCYGSNKDFAQYDYMTAEWEMEKNRPPVPTKLISGKRVMEITGLPGGRRIGEILRLVDDAVLEGAITTPDEALQFVREL